MRPFHINVDFHLIRTNAQTLGRRVDDLKLRFNGGNPNCGEKAFASF